MKMDFEMIAEVYRDHVSMPRIAATMKIGSWLWYSRRFRSFNAAYCSDNENNTIVESIAKHIVSMPRIAATMKIWCTTPERRLARVSMPRIAATMKINRRYDRTMAYLFQCRVLQRQ